MELDWIRLRVLELVAKAFSDIRELVECRKLERLLEMHLPLEALRPRDRSLPTTHLPAAHGLAGGRVGRQSDKEIGNCVPEVGAFAVDPLGEKHGVEQAFGTILDRHVSGGFEQPHDDPRPLGTRPEECGGTRYRACSEPTHGHLVVQVEGQLDRTLSSVCCRQ